MEILLMTGTIVPLCNIKYCNPEIRCKEYERNIERYIKNSNFDIIIFAENSGYEFDYERYQKMADKVNKVFEYLNVKDYCTSETISIGDAQIMKAALQCSKYLEDDSVFIWKVSGRIYIQNVNKILQKHKGIDENVFLYAPKYNSIQTWFFKIKLGDLKQYLLSDFTINTMYSMCIEYAWMNCYQLNKNRVSINKFKCYPDCEGINSSGQPYTMSRTKYILKCILLHFGYFTVK